MRDPVFREELLSNDFVFEGRVIPCTPPSVHVVPVHLRGLPVELAEESVKSAFSAFGDVFTVSPLYFKVFPSLRNGNRILLMSLGKPIPSSLNVLAFQCPTW